MREPRSLRVVCPRCGLEGSLYYSRKLGFYIKHRENYRETHYVSRNESVEIVLRKDRLNLIWYIGGDTFLLPYIAKMIPPHTCYVEVFGGGAPLLLNKPPSKVEVYNDIYGDIVNLFMVVRDRADEFVERLELLPFSRELHYRFIKDYRDRRFSDDVDRAVKFFYILRTSFSGKLGSGFSTSARINQPRKFYSAVDNVKEISRRLRNVIIENLDFRELIAKYDSSNTFFYLDPPHLYTATEKGKEYYAYGFSDRDYMDLLSIIEKIKGKFLLKQVASVGFVDEWAERNGFNKAIVEIAKSSKYVRASEKKDRQRVLFIANYRLKI